MKNNKKTGFTLIEVLVAVFLSTIVLSAVYAVWLRVTRVMSKANAKQTLQTQLRKATNQMKNDLSAIKGETFVAPADKQSADGTSAYFEFERFSQTEDGKLAQDSSEKISYNLNNGLLTRKSPSKIDILATSLDTLTIEKGTVETAVPSDDLMKSAREAMLNIELIGKRSVKGSKEVVYHAERTSVVMRDQYYKKANSSYVSNFDLAKLERKDIIMADISQDHLLTPGTELTLEQVDGKYTQEQLDGFVATQKDMLEQALDSIDQQNDQIDDVDSGTGAWSTFWNKVSFGNLYDNDSFKVKDMKKELVDADSTEKIEVVIDKLEVHVVNSEKAYLNEATGKNFTYKEPFTEEEQIYKRAFEMKLQDRNIEGAYKKLKEEDEDDTTEKPPRIIDSATTITGATWTDENGVEQHTDTSTDEYKATVAEAAKLKAAYDSIDLGFMGEYGEEDDDVKAYNAAKTLVGQAKSKKDVMKLKETASSNIDVLGKAKAKPKS